VIGVLRSLGSRLCRAQGQAPVSQTPLSQRCGEGLLVDPAGALHVADIEIVLGAAVARAFALEFAVRLLFGFGFLQGAFSKALSPRL